MDKLISTYFGPLDNRSCYYFFIISVIFFVSFLILLLGEIVYIIRHYNRMDFRVISSGLIVIFNTFLAYFVNRLLFTMCNKSLK
jgi:hypothetical protein